MWLNRHLKDLSNNILQQPYYYLKNLSMKSLDENLLILKKSIVKQLK